MDQHALVPTKINQSSVLTFFSPERSPLVETQKSLETLIKLATNPECLSSLLDGLTGCIQAIVTVIEQVENERLDRLLANLLNQIVQVCLPLGSSD